MSAPHRPVECSGPDDPHAFEGIPILHRTGELDVPCPDCRGHGQWNLRIDLGTLRAQRTICHTCEGRGWIETGDDHIAEPDTELSPEGKPRWIVRLSRQGE